MQTQETKNETNAENDPVRELVATLGRVDAPLGFERQVMNRIAAGKSPAVRGRAMFLLGLKFAAPALVLLLLGVFLVYFNATTPETAQLPEVIDAFTDQPQKTEVAASENVQAAVNGSPNVTPAAADDRANSTAARRAPNTKTTKPEGGSEDLAVTPANEPVYPPGVDPTRRIAPGKSPKGGSIAAADVLSILGLESSCSATGCTVNAVQPNSVAGKVDVQVGDIVEAIDDRVIGPAFTVSGTLSVRTLRVNRNGRSFTVNLGGK